MKNVLLMAVLGVMVFSTVAFAANKEGEFSLSPVIGGYTFDDRQHLNTNPVYGIRAGYNFTKHIGIEALFDYVNTSFRNSSKDVNVYRYGGEFLFHFFPDSAFVPYVAAGFGGLSYSTNVEQTKNQGVVDYGIGAKYFINDYFALRADVRHLITVSHPKNNVEYTVGAYFPLGSVPRAAKPVEPPPQPQAPPLPIVKLTAYPKSIMKGQESTLSWTGENVLTCAIEPGIGQVELQGTKVVTPPESTLYTLICSNGSVRLSSVATVDVNTPPPPAPIVEPVKPKPTSERFCNRPAILNVHFDFNKSDVKPGYHDELKSVGDFLNAFPESKGEISGHTDSIGSQRYNQKLSERRANSVKKYIVEKFGINPVRISTKGYGKLKPIDSNKSAKGRAKNRRIEANFECK